jgi:hypothetical protein
VAARTFATPEGNGTVIQYRTASGGSTTQLGGVTGKAPNGIDAVGYTEADIPDLVPGTMKQQRILATCPRPVDEEDIAGIFARSIENW